MGENIMLMVYQHAWSYIAFICQHNVLIIAAALLFTLLCGHPRRMQMQ